MGGRKPSTVSSPFVPSVAEDVRHIRHCRSCSKPRAGGCSHVQGIIQLIRRRRYLWFAELQHQHRGLRLLRLAQFSRGHQRRSVSNPLFLSNISHMVTGMAQARVKAQVQPVGTCYRLTGQTDSSGNRLSNAGTSIVVMMNNLCPANGNPLCSQNGLSGTNQHGANVNFDLCRDSGATEAFFRNSAVGLAIDTAEEVDCSEWSGTVV